MYPVERIQVPGNCEPRDRQIQIGRMNRGVEILRAAVTVSKLEFQRQTHKRVSQQARQLAWWIDK